MANTQQSKVIAKIKDQLLFATQHSEVDEPNLVDEHLCNISNIIENYSKAAIAKTKE